MTKIKEYAKFVAAILAAIATGIVQLAIPIPATILLWVQLAVVVGGAISVYAVPNADKPGGTEPPPFDDEEPADDGAGDQDANDPNMVEATAGEVNTAFVQPATEGS